MSDKGKVVTVKHYGFAMLTDEQRSSYVESPEEIHLSSGAVSVIATATIGQKGRPEIIVCSGTPWQGNLYHKVTQYAWIRQTASIPTGFWEVVHRFDMEGGDDHNTNFPQF